MDKEIARQQLITFATEQEVCDVLGLTVEELLTTFDEEFNVFVDEETRVEEEEEE